MSDKPAFDLNVSEENGVKIFHMIGRLMDQQQADNLMDTLDAEIGKGFNNVVLDMSGLQYMNSTGLNILINVLTKTRNAGGDVVIAGLSQSVRQLFLVTKLDSVFGITADVPAAVAKLRP